VWVLPIDVLCNVIKYPCYWTISSGFFCTRLTSWLWNCIPSNSETRESFQVTKPLPSLFVTCLLIHYVINLTFELLLLLWETHILNLPLQLVTHIEVHIFSSAPTGKCRDGTLNGAITSMKRKLRIYSSLNMETGLGAGPPGFKSRQEIYAIFSSPPRPDRLCEPTNLLYNAFRG